jgi:hypothetical protein
MGFEARWEVLVLRMQRDIRRSSCAIVDDDSYAVGDLRLARTMPPVARRVAPITAPTMSGVSMPPLLDSWAASEVAVAVPCSQMVA